MSLNIVGTRQIGGSEPAEHRQGQHQNGHRQAKTREAMRLFRIVFPAYRPLCQSSNRDESSIASPIAADSAVLSKTHQLLAGRPATLISAGRKGAILSSP